MVNMRRRAVVVLVACGVCVAGLAVVLVRAGTPSAPGAPGAASGAYAAYGSATQGNGGGSESADSSAPQAINSVLFSKGACMAFLPTNGDRHETVFLDAGHGGIDPGGVGKTESGTSVDESTVNLAIEFDTMAILRAHGYRVVVSRTGNTTVTRLTSGDVDGGVFTVRGDFNDVAARDVCANLANADVLPEGPDGDDPLRQWQLEPLTWKLCTRWKKSMHRSCESSIECKVSV